MSMELGLDLSWSAGNLMIYVKSYRNAKDNETKEKYLAKIKMTLAEMTKKVENRTK